MILLMMENIIIELIMNFKYFLKDNSTLIVSILIKFMIYFEKLYFKLAIDEKGGELGKITRYKKKMILNHIIKKKVGY